MIPKEGTSERRGLKILLKDYLRNCRRKNRYWELTLEQFHTLTSSPCFYCEKPPYLVIRRNGGSPTRIPKKDIYYAYTGLDRIVNAKGYTLDNVIPCCGRCNSIKGDKLTMEEMKAAMQAINEYHRLRGVKPVLSE